MYASFCRHFRLRNVCFYCSTYSSSVLGKKRFSAMLGSMSNDQPTRLRKSRWSKVYESAEGELIQFLAAKGIAATRWTAEDSDELTPDVSAVDMRLWCAEGSLVITANDKAVSVQPGDMLDIPAGTSYHVRAGFTGCVCYQAPHERLPKL